MKSILIPFIFLISQIAFAQQQCFTNCSSGSCITTCNPTNTQNLGDAFANGLKSGQDIGNSIRQNREAQQRADQLQQQQQQQSQTQQANADGFKRSQDELKARIEEICGTVTYKDYFSKTACKASDISFDQQLDSSKITSAQKILLKEIQPKQVAISREVGQSFKTYYGATGVRVSDLVEGKLIPESEKNALALYSGKITWGEYNTKRKEIFTSYMSDIRAISSSK